MRSRTGSAPRKISINERLYPDSLKNIFNPPPELFVEGDILPEDNNAIAIVGTRRATYYGLEQCEKISYELALKGITVISGMARGIDSAAHRGALAAGGRTIAVLGSGHNNIYPSENRQLYGKIVKSGAVISEFPPDMPPLKVNFPRRNRVISGLSKGVVVIEAAIKSGSLITANFALEQGREVFAMPGNVSSRKSNGTNALIKEGAKLVVNADDILEELKYVIVVKDAARPAESGKGKKEISRVSLDEKRILGILNEEPKSIDDISNTVNIPSNRASELLIRLELKKLVRVYPGENFARR